MDYQILTVGGFAYKISVRLVKEDTKENEYVLCLDEVKDNALPQNKNRQVPVVYQWGVGSDCNGCRRILETTDPKLIKKGIKKFEDLS